MSKINENIKLFSKNHFNEKGRRVVVVLVMQLHDEGNKTSEE
ncbi:MULTISPECIES: hypothetical protein [Bacillaceae]|nr:MULTISPECIES: hypothetical protein [Bacillaceae]